MLVEAIRSRLSAIVVKLIVKEIVSAGLHDIHEREVLDAGCDLNPVARCHDLCKRLAVAVEHEAVWVLVLPKT